MASGGHLLAQQRPNVESRIKSLLNADLKEICKAYGAAVSGTKIVLQKRCIQVLEEIISRGDSAGFEEFKHRVANHGAAPVPGNPSYGGSASGYRPATMAPNGVSRGFASSNSNSRPLSFKKSPFYDEVETVLPPTDLPEMPGNRHTVSREIKLSENQARQLKDDPNMRLMIYCGINTGLPAEIDVAFPNQIEVKVNTEDVKSNFKGLKNQAGSTKPADITSYIRKLNGYANQVSICYALTQKRFTYIVRLVKRHSAADLAQRIKNGNVISKAEVIKEMSKANADPDIAATSSKMSLKDPVSITRITMPIRSSVCQHNQCFDGRFFMELQEQAPTWSCPICAKTVSFQSLSVDKYFEEILNTTSKSIEQVTIEPNGDWSVDQDDEDKGKSNHAKGEARAAWDDDFDDDIVEVLDSPKAPTNGVKHEYAASPMGPPGFSFNTPPLSSREASVARSNASAQRPVNGNKRSANAVIDLTLDDEDEEQPPRPAKRQTTGNSLGGPTSSYNTPLSLPEPTRHQAYFQQPTESSTTYRPYGTGQPLRPLNTTQPAFSESQSPSRASPFTNFHPQQQYLSSRPDSQSPALANGYGSFGGSMRPPSQGYGTSQSPVAQMSPQPPQQQNNHTFAYQPVQNQQQQQQHELFDFGRTQREMGNWRTDYGSYGDPK